MKCLSIIFGILLTVTAHAQQLTNVIYGNVGDYSLNPQKKITLTTTLIYPNPRSVGNVLVRQDPNSTMSETNGYFAFTNQQWGYYSLSVSGSSGTHFGYWVAPDSQGNKPIGSLVTGNPYLPPDPANNYYTQAQIDALIGGIPFVTQLFAGPGIALAPGNGLGAVTISVIGGIGGSNYQSQAGNNLLTMTTNTSTSTYTFFGVAQTNANMQLWGQITPTAYSNAVIAFADGRYDPITTAAAIGLAATNYANSIGASLTNNYTQTNDSRALKFANTANVYNGTLNGTATNATTATTATQLENRGVTLNGFQASISTAGNNGFHITDADGSAMGITGGSILIIWTNASAIMPFSLRGIDNVDYLKLSLTNAFLPTLTVKNLAGPAAVAAVGVDGVGNFTTNAVPGGGGGGLTAANNLSDVASAAISLANLHGAVTNYGTTLEIRFANGAFMRTNTAPPYNWRFENTNAVVTLGTNGVTLFTFGADGSITTSAGVTLDSLGGITGNKLFAGNFSANSGVYANTSLQLVPIPTGVGAGTNNGAGGFGYSTNLPGPWVAPGTLPKTSADSTWMPITNALAWTNTLPLNFMFPRLTGTTNQYQAYTVIPQYLVTLPASSDTNVVVEKSDGSLVPYSLATLFGLSGGLTSVTTTNAQWYDTNTTTHSALSKDVNDVTSWSTNGTAVVSVNPANGSMNAAMGVFGGATQLGSASNTITGTLYLGQTNLAPMVYVSNPVVDGGYWTNLIGKGTLYVNYTLTDSAISGDPGLNMTNIISTDWFRATNGFALSGVTANRVSFAMALNDYFFCTNQSDGSASAKVNASRFVVGP